MNGFNQINYLNGLDIFTLLNTKTLFGKYKDN